jgi:hypothetical protein
MKIKIFISPRYPDYAVRAYEENDWGSACEIDQPTFERWEKALEDYNEAQREISKLLEDQSI